MRAIAGASAVVAGRIAVVTLHQGCIWATGTRASRSPATLEPSQLSGRPRVCCGGRIGGAVRRRLSVEASALRHPAGAAGLHGRSPLLRLQSDERLIALVRRGNHPAFEALLLREIDALSYEQIAEAMETTVPSVKSLLVRARVSLAEAAEARLLSCEEVRFELAEGPEGLRRTSPRGGRPPPRLPSPPRCRSRRPRSGPRRPPSATAATATAPAARRRRSRAR